MPALITVLGSCLVAASGAMYSWSAVAADRPANPPGEPWWNNPPTATGTTSGPGLTDPGPADHDQGDKAPDTLPAAGSGARIAEVAPPGGAGLVAEFAPDPPGTRHSDGAPAAGRPPPSNKMPRRRARPRQVSPQPVRRRKRRRPPTTSTWRPRPPPQIMRCGRRSSFRRPKVPGAPPLPPVPCRWRPRRARHRGARLRVVGRRQQLLRPRPGRRSRPRPWAWAVTTTRMPRARVRRSAP